MDDGLESRKIVHKILKIIKINSTNFDEAFSTCTADKKLTIQNSKFIHNTTLTTIRNYLLIKKIILNLVPKIDENSDSFILLLSSITQIIFLKIKEYAVVNSAVELSKKKEILTSDKFINGCLRNFLRNKESFLKYKIDYNDLPKWFVDKTINLKNTEKKIFLENYWKQPGIHLVFKKKEYIKKYLNFGLETSENSLAINPLYTLKNIPNFDNGEWWIQDFSVMLPLSEIDISKYKNIADVGSAPGGKLFQLLSKNKNVTSFEKNKKRITRLNENLKRLKFENNVKAVDFLEIKEDKQYDLIVLDAPCSSIGTIKRNPEIFFKKQIPNFKYLINLQEKLLEKSNKLLKRNGALIYMVCSFLDIETIKQISNFLKKNKNYVLSDFKIKNNKIKNLNIDKNYINIIPTNILNDVQIDGYFAAKLIKKND